ncbi:hypothetical protein [Winogradskyella sp.]|uniref:hypothetical protein n=1 Tax=Winogradskyella sp. TaxID=1883156 RepID=UPI0035161906
MSTLPVDVEAKLSTKLPLYDEVHGGPYDRGGADSYYGRSFDPHYWPEGTNKGTRIEMKEFTITRSYIFIPK